MTTRTPFRAGSFYEASPEDCQQHAQNLVDAAEVPADLPAPRYGGLVPHAGWVFSGRLAAMTFKALLAEDPPETLVLFGADHTGSARVSGSVAGHVWVGDAWQTPLGEVAVDADFADALLADAEAGPYFRADPQAHAGEHSIEVQVPLVKLLAPQTKILPITMGVTSASVDAGAAIAEFADRRGGGRVAFVGSTDLTHHGGHFGNPGGYGPDSEAYARRNDRRMLDLIEALAVDDILPEAMSNHNACGAGAIAATIAAAKQQGATSGCLLEYTNSYQVIREQYPAQRDDTTVGYASVVFV